MGTLTGYVFLDKTPTSKKILSSRYMLNCHVATNSFTMQIWSKKFIAKCAQHAPGGLLQASGGHGGQAGHFSTAMALICWLGAVTGVRLGG